MCHAPEPTALASGVARQKRQSKLGLWNSLCTTEPALLEVIKWVSKLHYAHIQLDDEVTSNIVYLAMKSRTGSVDVYPIPCNPQFQLQQTPRGGTPYMMGDTYVPQFWPPFLTLWVPNSIFLGCFFLIHQHKNDLLGTNPHKIRSFWTQNTIFPSIFLGPIFSGPRHTPSNFRTEYPPPPGNRPITVKICDIKLTYVGTG